MAHIQADDRAHRPLVETSAQIQRTMVVGLGGTGGEIIKRLKRRLGRQGRAATHIRYLSLDTDVRTWLASLQFPALEPRERVPLHYANPQNVLEAPHLYPTVQHLFHQGRRVDISLLADQSGAGLMPVVGRTAFHLNAGQIYAHLQRALKDLQAIPGHPGGQPLTEEFRVYVVGSVAGGTGAGTFLETAVLLRHVLRSFKYQLTGILVLPEAFAPTLRGQQLDAQARGNAYAVLKELQYLQDGPAHWEDPETYTFQYQLGSETRSIALQERPFHILYVIDNQNQHGGALRNLSDIYEMAAQQLSVEIGSPLGAKFASAQANDRAIMGLAPCPETGRPCNISSLATAALVVPQEKLLRYCARRWVQEAVGLRLLGQADGDDQEAARWAGSWLMASQWEERGGHRMISRALLTDPKEERELTGAEFAVDGEALLERRPERFLAALAAQEEHFGAVALPGIRAMVEQNLERLRRRLPERIEAMLEEALTSRGVRAALARRAALERELEAMASEMAARQREDEAVREEQAEAMASRREELGRSGLLGGLLGRRRELMRLLGRMQGDLMQLELDLLARAAALRLVEGARAVLSEHRRRLEALEAHLVRVRQTAEAELTQERWAADTGAAYALETEVIAPGQFPAYYDRFRPASPEAFLAEVGEGEGLLRALAGQPYGEVAGRVSRAARALFAEQVAALNVVDVLQDLGTREEAFALLDDLASRCQPFWTATPRGPAAFSDVFLIGSPGVRPGGPGTPVQAEPLLQEWVEQHGGGGGGLQGAPTYVALGSPGAIIFSRQTHGARLHYMRQVLDYQEHYRALQQQRGYPVHFRPALEALPELRPDDEKATEAWALAVAYGMVAARTFGWVWALEAEERRAGEDGGAGGGEVLRTGSLWDLAAEIAPVEPCDIPPHSSRFLHATRAGALGRFGQRREWPAAVERMVDRRLATVGKQAVAAELTRYLEGVLGPRIRRGEEMETATLCKEQAALRRFLTRLNL